MQGGGNPFARPSASASQPSSVSPHTPFVPSHSGQLPPPPQGGSTLQGPPTQYQTGPPSAYQHSTLPPSPYAQQQQSHPTASYGPPLGGVPPMSSSYLPST